MQYKCLAPEIFVPSCIHVEMGMGMVNQIWEDMQGWIDDEVEVLPKDEKAAQKSLLDAKENLDKAQREKCEAKITINLER